LNIRNGTSVGESLLQPKRFREWVTALVAHDIAIHQLLPNGETATFAASDAIPQTANNDLRVSVVGVALNGQPLTETTITSAVENSNGIQPIGDEFGSAEYRAEMARVTLRRALMDCVAQLS
jgi:CO/xanthine dehydrogenase FAD-binding subunit